MKRGKQEVSGRTAQALTVSMKPEEWALVDDRVRALKLKGRSHYFQLLVELDKKQRLIRSNLPEDKNDQIGFQHHANSKPDDDRRAGIAIAERELERRKPRRE